MEKNLNGLEAISTENGVEVGELSGNHTLPLASMLTDMARPRD